MKRQRSENEEPDPKKRIRVDEQDPATFLSKFSDVWLTSNQRLSHLNAAPSFKGVTECETLLELTSNTDPAIVEKALRCCQCVGQWLSLAWKRGARGSTPLEALETQKRLVKHVPAVLPLLENPRFSLLVLQYLNKIPDIASCCCDDYSNKVAQCLDQPDGLVVVEACLLLSRPDATQDPKFRQIALQSCRKRLLNLLESEDDAIFHRALYASFRLMEIGDFFEVFIDLFTKKDAGADKRQERLKLFICPPSWHDETNQLLLPLVDVRGIQFLTKLAGAATSTIPWIATASGNTKCFVFSNFTHEPVAPLLEVLEAHLPWLLKLIESSHVVSDYLSLCHNTLFWNTKGTESHDRCLKLCQSIVNYIETILFSEKPIPNIDGIADFLLHFVDGEKKEVISLVLNSQVPTLLIGKKDCQDHLVLGFLVALIQIYPPNLRQHTQPAVSFACKVILESEDEEDRDQAVQILEEMSQEDPSKFDCPHRELTLQKVKSLIFEGSFQTRYLCLIQHTESKQTDFWESLLSVKPEKLLIRCLKFMCTYSFATEKFLHLFRNNNAVDLIFNAIDQPDESDLAVKALRALKKLLKRFSTDDEITEADAHLLYRHCIPKLIKILSESPTEEPFAGYPLPTQQSLSIVCLMRMLQDGLDPVDACQVFVAHDGLTVLIDLLKSETEPALPGWICAMLFQMVTCLWRSDEPTKTVLKDFLTDNALALSRLSASLRVRFSGDGRCIADVYWLFGSLMKQIMMHERVGNQEFLLAMVMSGIGADWKDNARLSSTWLDDGCLRKGDSVWENAIRCLCIILPNSQSPALKLGLTAHLTEMMQGYPPCRSKILDMLLTGLSDLPDTTLWESFQYYPPFIPLLSTLSRTDGTIMKANELWGMMMDDDVQRHFKVIAYSSNYEYAWASLAFLHAKNGFPKEGTLKQDIQSVLLTSIGVTQEPKDDFHSYLSALAAPLYEIEKHQLQFPRFMHGALSYFQDCKAMKIHNDVVLSVGTKQIPCHKLILCHFSEYFTNLFNSKMKESKSSEPIVITEEDPDSFEKMIQFLYVQKLEVQSFQELLDLFEVAHMYCVKDLMVAVMREVVESMAVEHFIAVFEMSITLSLNELSQKLVTWLLWHLDQFSAQQIEELKTLRKQISELFVGWD